MSPLLFILLAWNNCLKTTHPTLLIFISKSLSSFTYLNATLHIPIVMTILKWSLLYFRVSLCLFFRFNKLQMDIPLFWDVEDDSLGGCLGIYNVPKISHEKVQAGSLRESWSMNHHGISPTPVLLWWNQAHLGLSMTIYLTQRQLTTLLITFIKDIYNTPRFLLDWITVRYSLP